MAKDYTDYLMDADNAGDEKRSEAIQRKREMYENERSLIEKLGDALGITNTVKERMDKNA